MRTSQTFASPEELHGDIDKYDLKTREGVAALENHICNDWTVYDILGFKSFINDHTHGSIQELRNLLRVWDRLTMLVWAHLGAQCAVSKDRQGMPKLDGWYIDIDDYGHRTLKEVMRETKKLIDLRGTIRAVDEKVDALVAKSGGGSRSSRDYAVTPEQLAEMLERLGAKRSARTIQMWEKHIETGGKAKRCPPPPEGYTLDTRLSLASASVWAEGFANQEKTRLHIKIAFDDRRHRKQ